MDTERRCGGSIGAHTRLLAPESGRRARRPLKTLSRACATCLTPLERLCYLPAHQARATPRRRRSEKDRRMGETRGTAAKHTPPYAGAADVVVPDSLVADAAEDGA